MAAVATSSLPQGQKEELLCTYAALILHDDGLEVTADNIKKLVTASGNSVEPYMPRLFASALQGHNVGDLLSGVGSVGAGAPVAAAGAGGDAAAAGGGDAGGKAAGKKKEEEEEEEEEDDLGFSLFD